MLDADSPLLGIRVRGHLIVTRRPYFSLSEARLL